MIWKIYFWASLVLNIMGVVLLLQTHSLAFIDVISLAWTVILLIAAYSYAYHKRIIKPKYWRIVVKIIIILAVISFFELFILPKDLLVNTFPILKSSINTSFEASLLGLLFVFPSIYATYKLSKPKH